LKEVSLANAGAARIAACWSSDHSCHLRPGWHSSGAGRRKAPSCSLYPPTYVKRRIRFCGAASDSPPQQRL